MEKKYEILKYLLNQTAPVSSSVIQEAFRHLQKKHHKLYKAIK